jgi:Domain of unknown function (DUF3516)
VAYLRATLQRVDSSLVAEWEHLLAEAGPQVTDDESGGPAVPAVDLTRDPQKLRACLRADLHLLVKALADRDYEEAASLVGAGLDQAPAEAWTAERFAQALAPFDAEHERVAFTHAARLSDKTIIEELQPRVFRVRQLLLAPTGDTEWSLGAEIDLRADASGEGRVMRLLEISS